jgi:outer membrane protein TolC
MACLRTGVVALLAVSSLSLAAQNPSSSTREPETYSHFLTPRVKAKSLPANERIRQYVTNGKLRLGLQDAVLLMLENNSNVQIEEMAIESQKFSLLSAHQIFDPLVTSSLDITRYSSPTYSQLQGVAGTTVANALTQTGAVSIQQFLSSGTTLVASLTSTKSSSNSSYNLFNPYYSSTLSVNITQPLLRKAGIFANTATLVIARRSLQQSRATFEAEVNDAVLQVIEQYWASIEARSTLDVQTKSLKLAETSYARDKHALELGALPPLDIYRSESEVASRKLQVIQAQQSLEQAEEALRLTLGGNQLPSSAASNWS